MKFQILLSLTTLATFLLQSYLVQHIQSEMHYYKPYFLLFIAHSSYLLIIPFQFFICKFLHQDTIDIFASRVLFKSEEITSSYLKLILLAFLISLIYNLGAYMWYLSCSLIPMGDLTAIYNSSCFFVYLFSLLFKQEKFSWKILSVVFCILGIGLISNATGAGSFSGYCFGITSSVCVGLYQVLYAKYAVPKEPSTFLSLHFTGLIGVSTVSYGLIPLLLLHFTGFETFEFPDNLIQFYILLVALLGLIFNSCFMLVIAFMGPLYAGLGIMLTIPLTIGFDFLFTGTIVQFNSVIGCVLIVFGFLMLSWKKSKAKEEVEPLL